MNLNEYIGIPWKIKGTDASGCDCWGLFRLIYAERFQIVLPAFHDEYDTIEDRQAIRELILGHMPEYLNPNAGWHEVYPGEERSGDGILMTLGSIPVHVGIVQKPGYLVHIDFGMSSSVRESYRAPKLCKRIVGFYRHNKVPA